MSILDDYAKQADADLHAAQSDDDVLNELAAMSRLEYDRVRVARAKALGCRPGTLDRLVAELRDEQQARATAEDGLIDVDEPHPEAVDGLALMRDLVVLLRRYAVLPHHAETAIALWVLGSYAYDNFRIFPKLLLSSPEKRCGKSTLLEIIRSLSHRALLASNITPSAIFRCIDAWQPTLLIDEADTFIHGNEELRGIINSGHTRSTAYVIRTVGDDFEPKQFSTWAPMVLAMIKLPPDTILDRSIVIPMRRKLPGETLERLPVDFPGECRTLRAKLLRWAIDHADALATRQPPAMPHSDNDRALDNWLPLLTLAETIGGKPPGVALEAFRGLQAEDGDDDSIGPLILRDIQNIFDGVEGGPRFSKLSGTELSSRLAAIEERPWAEWKHGKPMTTTGLSRLLKPFGVKSQRLWFGAERLRGYEREWFEDGFVRYLGTPEERVEVSQPSNHAASSDFQPVQASVQDTFNLSRDPPHPEPAAPTQSPAPPEPGHFKMSLDTFRTDKNSLEAAAGAGWDRWTRCGGVATHTCLDAAGDRI